MTDTDDELNPEVMEQLDALVQTLWSHAKEWNDESISPCLVAAAFEHVALHVAFGHMLGHSENAEDIVGQIEDMLMRVETKLSNALMSYQLEELLKKSEPVGVIH